MASAVVDEDAARGAQARDSNAQRRDNPTSLFNGKKLWFSYAVPQRRWLVERARANGAIIVAVEKDADVLLVDHAKKPVVPGTHSYRYVELSLRNSALENLDEHLVSSSTRAERTVGSIATAVKGGRNPFTAEEDQLLWNWVKPFMDAGGQWKGNEIYKQLERHHPRHTFQSWRDRWIKYTRYQHREVTSKIGPAYEGQGTEVAENQPELISLQTPSNPRPVTSSKNVTSNNKTTTAQRHLSPDVADERLTHPHFSEDEIRMLMCAVPHILVTKVEELDRSWANVATEYPAHKKDEWRTFFEEVIVPAYRRREGLEEPSVFEKHLEDHQQTVGDKTSRGNNHENIEQQTINGSTELNAEAIIEGRAPGANEARKRSRPSDQSSSTQSQSQSALPSDLQSRLSQEIKEQIHTGPITVESYPTGSSANKGYKFKYASGEDAHEESHRPKRLKLSQILAENTNDRTRRDEDRQVTQASDVEHDHLQDSHDDAIHAYNKLTVQARQSASPSLLGGVVEPEDEDLFAAQVAKPGLSQARGSDVPEDDVRRSLSVQLVEEDTDVEPEELGSQYAPSEAPSEGVQFDHNPTLSQAWETSPDDETGDAESEEDQEFHRDTNEFETANETTSITSSSDTAHDQPRRSSSIHDSGHNTDHGAQNTQKKGGESMEETVEESLYHSARDVQPPTAGTGKVDPVDTQALFQQPVQLDMEDFLAIVPPEGGWSDDEDAVVTEELIVEPRSDTSQSSKNNPDEIVASGEISEAQATTEEEMLDLWLEQQKLLYNTTETNLVEHICFKALECTSMEITSATDVVAAMIQKYRKGKHRASLFETLAEDFDQGTPRSKARRKAAEEAALEFVPREMRGCWTHEDDRALMGGEARKIERVERKHGEESVRLRFEYLERFHGS